MTSSMPDTISVPVWQTLGPSCHQTIRNWFDLARHKLTNEYQHLNEMHGINPHHNLRNWDHGPKYNNDNESNQRRASRD